MLAQNLHEFKCWMQEKLDKKEGASADDHL